MPIKLIEELSMNAWPSLQTKLYDGWVLRFADGYTKRANSINPIYKSTIELDKKIDYCEKQYKFYNLPTIFKLTDESYPKEIDKRLKERGYEKIDETSVRILDFSQYTYRKPEGVILEDQFSGNWINAFFHCSKIPDEGVQLTARKILDNILGRVICAARQIDGNIAGCGYGAIDRDYVGIFDIVVDKNFRGNGYGQDIMDGILGEAFRMGNKIAYLQVVVGNLPAENLYNKFGFSEVYRYWYRKLEKIREQ